MRRIDTIIPVASIDAGIRTWCDQLGGTVETQTPAGAVVRLADGRRLRLVESPTATTVKVAVDDVLTTTGELWNDGMKMTHVPHGDRGVVIDANGNTIIVVTKGSIEDDTAHGRAS